MGDYIRKAKFFFLRRRLAAKSLTELRGRDQLLVVQGSASILHFSKMIVSDLQCVAKSALDPWVGLT